MANEEWISIFTYKTHLRTLQDKESVPPVGRYIDYLLLSIVRKKKKYFTCISYYTKDLFPHHIIVQLSVVKHITLSNLFNGVVTKVRNIRSAFKNISIKVVIDGIDMVDFEYVRNESFHRGILSVEHFASIPEAPMMLQRAELLLRESRVRFCRGFHTFEGFPARQRLLRQLGQLEMLFDKNSSVPKAWLGFDRGLVRAFFINCLKR